MSFQEPGMVVHICNPDTREAEREDSEFKASLGNKAKK
jgi:hypothetical protein